VQLSQECADISERPRLWRVNEVMFGLDTPWWRITIFKWKCTARLYTDTHGTVSMPPSGTIAPFKASD
jgi:hypothetical protein